MLQFVFTVAVRFSYRFILLERNRNKQSEEDTVLHRVMLIGAGAAGQIIIRDLNRASEMKAKVCCIIDDNPNKMGRYIEGIPIVGNRDDILLSAEKYKIDQILLAIPSASAEEKRDILNICKETGCEMKILPGNLPAGERRSVDQQDEECGSGGSAGKGSDQGQYGGNLPGAEE